MVKDYDTLINGTLDLAQLSSLSLEVPQERISLLAYTRDGVRVLPLAPGRKLVIGRGLPADAPLRDPSISRQHAAFELVGDTVWIEDLGSTNGIKVNGERATRSEVRPGDNILLGSVRVSLHSLTPMSPDFGGLHSHDQLQMLLENDIARASFYRREVALLLIRGEGDIGVDRFASAVQQRLRPIDRAALHDPQTLEILISEPAQDPAKVASDIIEAAYADADDEDDATLQLRCGVASFPQHASSAEELISVCRTTLARATVDKTIQVAGPLATVRTGWADQGGDTEMVIASPAMENVYRLCRRVAETDLTVLICGETGSGKELVARAIHYDGTRKDGPMRVVNCAAIPDNLLESTLFGHERGAFTDATERVAGVFEQASGGTVFLDEVGELSLASQPALLRVLETKRVTRVGGSGEIPVDVRVIAATHRDLEKMCEAGSFRWDLLYRLTGVIVEVPALRERPEEIAPLVRAFLATATTAAGRNLTIDPSAMDVLARYDWPGNVRQLRNVVERAAIVAHGDVITVDDLPERVRTLGMSDMVLREPRPQPKPAQTDQAGDHSFRQRIQRFEAALLLDALHRSGWNQAKAARLLGTTARAVYHKCSVYKIKKGSTETADLERDLGELLGLTFADEQGRRVPFKQQVQRYETELISAALAATGFNKAEAARQLLIPLRTLVYKVRQYRIREE